MQCYLIKKGDGNVQTIFKAVEIIKASPDWGVCANNHNSDVIHASHESLDKLEVSGINSINDFLSWNSELFKIRFVRISRKKHSYSQEGVFFLRLDHSGNVWMVDHIHEGEFLWYQQFKVDRFKKTSYNSADNAFCEMPVMNEITEFKFIPLMNKSIFPRTKKEITRRFYFQSAVCESKLAEILKLVSSECRYFEIGQSYGIERYKTLNTVATVCLYG